MLPWALLQPGERAGSESRYALSNEDPGRKRKKEDLVALSSSADSSSLGFGS